jgi:hypothetical protein
MKKLLALGLLISVTNVFSQSYLILSNGVTLTTDSNGVVYDKRYFYLPYKVNITGGNFFVEDEKLVTIDSNGFLFEKDFEVKKIKGQGNNFFIDSNSDLVTIDSKGFFYKYDKDSKIFSKAVIYGGNYFLVSPKFTKPVTEIYTINVNGNFAKINVEGLNPADINFIGGTYFQTKNGVVYTVSKEGFIFGKPDMKVGVISKFGGNFFINEKNFIYTVSEEGFLLMPSVSKTFNATKIEVLASNYMIDSDGKMFVVTKSGSIVEAKVEHDLRNAKLTSKY